MENRGLKELLRLIKYGLVASSAALIPFGVCTLMNEVLHIDYWISYLVALILSVLLNFTINKKITFKSIANIPIAMVGVGILLRFYAAFTFVFRLGNQGSQLTENDCDGYKHRR